MKGDLQDLKHLVFELIRGNNLHVPETVSYRTFNMPSAGGEVMSGHNWEEPTLTPILTKTVDDRGPIILDEKKFDKSEEIMENLALEDMEKDMIKKSLKRHGGRRKEAALELGISERTLYRKIKQYDI